MRDTGPEDESKPPTHQRRRLWSPAASTSTAVAVAHCKVYESWVATGLREHWLAAGFLVVEYAQTSAATMLHAMAPPPQAPLRARTSAENTRWVRDRLALFPGRVGARSTWTGSGQPVWTVHPLEPTGVELFVDDDEDAFIHLDVLAPGLSVARDDITIKPRVGWCGYGDPRLDSHRRRSPWP